LPSLLRAAALDLDHLKALFCIDGPIPDRARRFERVEVHTRHREAKALIQTGVASGKR
jgi:hypothetical protein